MKTIQGVVTSLKREGTATVEVVKRWTHPIYKKSVNRSKKYSCDLNDLKLSLGDKVQIMETRPISKTKNFKVVKKEE